MRIIHLNRAVLIFACACLLVAAVLTGAASAQQTSDEAGSQTFFRVDARQTVDGPEEFFTGRATIERLFPSNETASFSGAYVTFEPGARSAWHNHPAGQHIVVVSGEGRTGTRGGPVEKIQAGDVVWCPPGVTHWHGASPTSSMTHLVITGSLDGSAVEWKEKVTDTEYDGQ